jgi:hypothetical protein
MLTPASQAKKLEGLLRRLELFVQSQSQPSNSKAVVAGAGAQI